MSQIEKTLLQSYKVDYEDFFRFDSSTKQREYFDSSHALCHESMSQLIARYSLQNKNILSVGTGIGFQEYCFYEHGCSLTCCDIDEDRIIEPHLKTVKEGGLHYIIGDAQELRTNEKFDVIYFSSFTPNELRNRNSPIARRVPRKLRRAIFNPIWHDKPFIDTVLNVLNNCLAKDGLFIYQSYASDVDASRPEYTSALRKQLEPLGIMLLDLYCFESYPKIHLIVAVRGKTPEFHHELTVFHGRGMAGISFKGIKKI